LRLSLAAMPVSAFRLTETATGQWTGGFSNETLLRRYVFRLWAFLTLGDDHHDFLTVTQRLSSRTVNCTVMHEYIFAACMLNESVSFFIIEPLNGTFYMF